MVVGQKVLVNLQLQLPFLPPLLQPSFFLLKPFFLYSNPTQTPLSYSNVYSLLTHPLHSPLLVEDDPLPTQILSYNRANRQVAILCNHQRAAPKNFDKQMENLQGKVGGLGGWVGEWVIHPSFAILPTFFSPLPSAIPLQLSIHHYHHHSPLPPPFTTTTTIHHYHHHSPLPPPFTTTTTIHHYHHHSPLPPPFTTTTTIHHYHHHSPLPPPFTTTTTIHHYHHHSPLPPPFTTTTTIHHYHHHSPLPPPFTTTTTTHHYHHYSPWTGGRKEVASEGGQKGVEGGEG